MTTAARPFFILTCARSGSTSLTRILDAGANATVAVEPAPNLNFETREAMEGRGAVPRDVVDRLIVPRVREASAAAAVYGEKNLTYGPFIPALHEALDCRFVLIVRDGRDVVRSLVDWHDQKFGSVYRECRERGNLSPEALFAAGALPVHLDTSDYARPRPRPGDVLHERWDELGRASMCAYYWSRINDLYLDQLASVPREDWIQIDYTTPGPEDVERVMRHCGIESPGRDVIGAMLDRRINSLADRGAAPGTYPDWPNWTSRQRREFDEIAGATMERLGFDGGAVGRWQPDGYAVPSPPPITDPAIGAWLSASVVGRGAATACDFGGDAAHLLGSNDLDVRSVPGQAPAALERADAAVAAGVLAMVDDVDQLIDRMVRTARRLVAVVLLEPSSMQEHDYRWAPHLGHFETRVSVSESIRSLERRGCTDIRVDRLRGAQADWRSASPRRRRPSRPPPSRSGSTPPGRAVREWIKNVTLDLYGSPVGWPLRRSAQVLERGQRRREGIEVAPDMDSFAPQTTVAGDDAYKAATGRDIDRYFELVRSNYAPYANPFRAYERLVEGLLEADVSLVPMFEIAQPRHDERPRIALRHDIDADPRTAIRMARFLARRGLCGSFYLLHSAPYYGDVIGDLFVRNPHLPGWVMDLVVAGCEIGLHNDALGMHLNTPLDGAQALATEIDWVRSHGATVRGTVAHNSAPSHGAENYEVFGSRVLWVREVRGPDGGRLPLGSLSEAAIGLAYEGTFGVPREDIDVAAARAFVLDRASADVRSQDWMRRYLLDNPCCSWAIDFQAWLTGTDAWVIAGRFHGRTWFEWEVGLEDLLEFVRNDLPAGADLMLVLHPAYFGADAADLRGEA